MGSDRAAAPAAGQRRWTRVVWALAAATVVAHLAVTWHDPPRVWDLKAGDLLFRLRNLVAAPAAPEDIVVVAVDEASMQEIGLPWPWPRALHANLVRALRQAGARVVAFDVVFASPTDELSDRLFAQAVAAAGNVVLAEDLDVTDDPQFQRQILVRPLDLLADAAASTGLAKIAIDPDGFLRRAYLEIQGRPSLGRATAELALGVAPTGPDEAARRLGLPHGLERPLLVNYLGPVRSVRTVSYYQALDPEAFLPPDTFRDAVVLVGRSLQAAAELGEADHFAFPFLVEGHGPIAGVEIHATVVDTILRHRFLRPLPAAAQSLLLAVFLAAAAAALTRGRHGFGVVAWVGLLALLALVQVGAFLLGRPPAAASSLAAFGLFFVAERVFKLTVVDREKRFIQKAFKHYVSPAVVDRMVADPSQLKLYGEYYDATVLFTDLAGFTTISERMDPLALRNLLTEYFSDMVEILRANDGTLDKFIGDAIMGFFGIPVRTERHALQAAATACGMQRRLAELNRGWAERGLPPLHMRIGLNTGRVVAGNIGTHDLFNFTVLGDAVNLASRLEGANKYFGTWIMISETTRAAVAGDFETRLLDRIRVKGKKEPVAVYELLGPRGSVEPERLRYARGYEAAFAAYVARDFAAALRLLDELGAAADDAGVALLRSRCEEYLGHPPGEDWDGAYTMTGK